MTDTVNNSDEVLDYMYEKDIADGKIRLLEDTGLTIKPGEFTVLNKDTGIEEVLVNHKW